MRTRNDCGSRTSSFQISPTGASCAGKWNLPAGLLWGCSISPHIHYPKMMIVIQQTDRVSTTNRRKIQAGKPLESDKGERWRRRPVRDAFRRHRPPRSLRRLSQQPDAVAASANPANRAGGIRSTSDSADRSRGVRSTANPTNRSRGIRSTSNPADRSRGISSANPANRSRGIRSSSRYHDTASSLNMVSDG